MDMTQAIATRNAHTPGRRWLRRGLWCVQCGDRYPCGPRRFAGARLLQLLTEAMHQAGGRR